MSRWACSCSPCQVRMGQLRARVCKPSLWRLHGQQRVHRPSGHRGLACAGLWSQIKRAPKAKQVRKVYEVDGPARQGALALDDRARQLFVYFKKYNYEVKETGEIIKFVGNYKASRGQAAALVFYVFCGERPLPAPEQPAA